MSSSSGSDSDYGFIDRVIAPKERTFKERINYLQTLDEEAFHRRFRLTKQTFRFLCDEIRADISPATARTHSISAESKLYAALRFYATGNFQTTVSDLVGISQQSVSRIVHQVSEAIARMKDRYIFMPRNRDEIQENFRQFFEIAPFPTVIGTIDCTHVKIKGQGGEDGEVFRNRKQFFSLNVQSVARADLSFQDIVVRWPGSTHDSFIFNQSRLKERFENGEFGNAVLLGDGGYKLQKYMMTPFRNPQTEDERHYNQTHIHVRNTVEREYGVWKQRFPCLVFGLRCNIDTTMRVIVACAVLHNICIQQNDPIPPSDDNFLDQLRRTTVAADNGSENIRALTRNNHRGAVLKRESFVQQIAQLRP